MGLKCNFLIDRAPWPDSNHVDTELDGAVNYALPPDAQTLISFQILLQLLSDRRIGKDLCQRETYFSFKLGMRSANQLANFRRHSESRRRHGDYQSSNSC